jgi:hypothetical protein
MVNDGWNRRSLQIDVVIVGFSAKGMRDTGYLG